MKKIHKIAAMVIENDGFLMVRKKGKDIWTNLGGKPEAGETKEEALLREIKEELGCKAEIIKYLGEFENKAALEDAIIHLSVYLVKLIGEPKVSDEELDEFKYLSEGDIGGGIKLPLSITEQILPYCIEKGLLNWK
jgi:8-oxo-dGTP diphosphatase